MRHKQKGARKLNAATFSKKAGISYLTPGENIKLKADI
jgi:hypothetical protein